MAGWGARGQTRLEDDALFKEIGDQLAGLTGKPFDYSQWQRLQAESAPKSPSTLSKRNRRPSQRPATVQTGGLFSCAERQ